MLNKRIVFWIFITFLSTLILSSCTNQSKRRDIDKEIQIGINNNKDSEGKTNNKTEVKTKVNKIKNPHPVLFLHGFSGTANSMGGMIKRLNKANKFTHNSLVINVNPNGEVSYTGTLEKEKVNLIQLLFSNNKAAISDQSRWFKAAMLELGKLGVTKVDVVAHSMGGEAVTDYLENSANINAPKINKFIPIATPFTWNFGGPDDFSVNIETLKQRNIFVQGKFRIPNDLSVLAIAGVVTNETSGDNKVPLISATFGKYIFKPENYQEKIVRGKKADHSQLHENTEVDLLVAGFLWRDLVDSLEN